MLAAAAAAEEEKEEEPAAQAAPLCGTQRTMNISIRLSTFLFRRKTEEITAAPLAAEQKEAEPAAEAVLHCCSRRMVQFCKFQHLFSRKHLTKNLK